MWQNFTEWFGDSKVVDAEGNPMVVYHATSAKQDFTEFKAGYSEIYGCKIYMSSSIESTNILASGTYNDKNYAPRTSVASELRRNERADGVAF